MSIARTFTDELLGFPERWKKFNQLLTTEASIAQTPKQLVWSLNKAKLYRYVPVVPAEKRHGIPLLLVFALMNRPYILDLRPGHSFVEFMVNRGYDVFLLDWGEPGLEDAETTLDDYVLEYLARAIRRMKALSGSREFSLLGWCIGAVLTTIYAALRPDDGLRNLLLLTPPLDFSKRDNLTFARWTDERFFDVDRILAFFGNMPGELIDSGAKALKPVENYITNYVRLWESLDQPRSVESWHAMNTWVTDNIPFAGAAYRQFIVELYRNNRLVRNELQIGGRTVNLSHLRANLLAILADGDHITPPCQCETILDKVGATDKQLYRVPGGHIGIMAGSSAHKLTWPHIDQWLGARSALRQQIL